MAVAEPNTISLKKPLYSIDVISLTTSTDASDNKFQISSATLHTRDGSQSSEIQWPRGWRPYVSLMLAGFCINRGLINSYGFFQRYYSSHHLIHGTSQATDMAIGLIGGSQAALCLSLSLFVGRLLDAGWYRQVVGFGGLLITLGYGTLGFCGDSNETGDLEHVLRYAPVLGLQGILSGVGLSCIFMFCSQMAIMVVIIADIHKWFPNHKYFALGITSTGIAVGGIIFPPTISHLVDAYGFAQAMRLLALIVGLNALLAFVFGAAKPGLERRPLGPLLKLSTWCDARAIKDMKFLVFSIGVGFIYLGMYPTLFHLTEWAERERFSGVDVVWCLALANGCGIIGRFFSALVGLLPARRSNPLFPLACSCFVCAVSTLLFWPLANQGSHALAFCVVLGVCLGLILGLPESGVAYLIPVESRMFLGAWTGTMRAFCSIFALIGPLLSGFLVRKWGLGVVGFLSGGSLMLSTVLFAVVLWMLSREHRSFGREIVDSAASDA